MDTFDIIFLTLIPAGLVSLVIYYVVKSFMEREHKQELVSLRLKSSQISLPLQLQAYERLSLFLERIAPNQLVLRIGAYSDEMTVMELQQLMVNEIREEYNHNVAQQIYMSEDAWTAVGQAKEEMIALINNVAEELDGSAPSIELAKKLFQVVLNANDDVVGQKLKIVREEARKLL